MKININLGLFGILGIAFVILKLCGIIDWSWWWVTAPFWISAIITGVILFVAGILLLLAAIGENSHRCGGR